LAIRLSLLLQNRKERHTNQRHERREKKSGVGCGVLISWGVIKKQSFSLTPISRTKQQQQQQQRTDGVKINHD
jgi:hypothetical protein